jgi:hypothetical protein
MRVHVANQLLRYRARSAAVTKKVVLDSPYNPNEVNTVMLPEAMILDRDKRVGEITGE